jgi:hypothetical protein
MNDLYHLTVNTGHGRLSPRHEVRDDTLPAVTPLLSPGDHPLPFELGREGWHLVVPTCPAGWLGTLYLRDVPMATVAVAATAADEAALWPALEALYLKVTDQGPPAAADWRAPHQPPGLPWCAAVLVGPLGAAAAWIGDFERCIAWAWLEQRSA